MTIMWQCHLQEMMLLRLEEEEEELEEDTELLIGPAPPAIVAEAASANEAERLEEVSKSPVILSSSVFHKFRSRKNCLSHGTSTEKLIQRIVGFAVWIFIIETKDEPSWHLPRYWKLSLLVCPDNCSHPHAHQAFVKLNKSL
ncbi:hypothetical protein NC651_030614 [Populus alba x Populus x berolinensis]|nr:hypothetical protein NC651_030614 [Populus alba x Populus x berolinensis]